MVSAVRSASATGPCSASLPSATASALSFLADGAPATTQGNALQRLASGSARVRIQAGSHTRDVLVAAETGRVTLQ